jgi:outer membrane protein
MKNFFRYAVLAAVLVLPGFARAEDARVGVMDPMRINDEARVMKSLNGQKDGALKKIRSEVDAKRKDFEKKEQELSSKQALVTEEVFVKEATKFRADVMEYDRQTAARVGDVEKAYVEAVKKVQRDYLDGIARKIGKEKGFDVVINAQAAIILNSSLDITSEVIDELDSKVKEIELKVK